MIYSVEIVEQSRMIVKVEAESRESAEAVVREGYVNGEYDNNELEEGCVSVNATISNQ